MSRVIWKFPLGVADVQIIDMPVGARPLSVSMQGERLCMWALVDDEAPKITRAVLIVGTGYPLSPEVSVERFLGTFMVNGGALVFHVFVQP